VIKYKKHTKRRVVRKRLAFPHGVSKEENEVSNMVALEFPGTPVYRSDRMVLHGRELDIYLPTKKLAIEFDGLKFHNSESKDKFYHLRKTIGCEKAGIRLIHIFSDEWELKKPLVIDLIRRSMGKFNTIDAGKCIIKPITRQEAKIFLDASDLRGDCPEATGHFGLFYNTDIVAVLSYKENKDETEILRYTERRLIRVDKGLEQLLTMIPGPYIARIDRRIMGCLDFEEAGFKKIEATEPKAYYTKDYKKRFLESELTEQQRSECVEIYDCGDIIMKKPSV